MSSFDLPFIPGKNQANQMPLARYLPPIPPGVASYWLTNHIPGGSWILDPFGSTPEMVVEMSRAGYRVLVTANNPVAGFMIEMIASAPDEAELKAALADLAAARKGDERLEMHIQSLYSVECANCKKVIQAKAFIWQKEGSAPVSCLVSCPFCGDTGERPVTPSNLERLVALGRGGLHRARAMERVTTLDDPIRMHVEQALNCYLPRPLYAVITMINRLESLSLSSSRHRLATALLLSACDEANTLWSYPTSRQRPRQLNVPSVFRENNLWISLETAIDQWKATGPAVPITNWPELPPESGGICLHKGRVRDLSDNLHRFPIQAVIAAFPRPNQALWTLSAVWSGWLWGRDAVAPLRNALSRQRYDWNWHNTALESTLTSVHSSIARNIPFFGLIGEAEPAFILAVLLAARNAGFDFGGAALRAEQACAQFEWNAGNELQPYEEPLFWAQIIKKAVKSHLEKRAEPAPYLSLFSSAAIPLIETRLSEEGINSATSEESPNEPSTTTRIQANIQKVLSDPAFTTRYGGTPLSFEHTSWWLTGVRPTSPSLSDSVENAIVQLLMQSPGFTYAEIDRSICNNFQGFLTPSSDLIRITLESYGEKQSGEESGWFLRPGESPVARRSDLFSIQRLLQDLGYQLEYTVEGDNPIFWRDQNNDLAYAFYLTNSGIINQFVASNPFPAEKSIIVLPGSRVNLVLFKLNHDTWLNQAVSTGWRFIKYRHLRQLASSLLPNRTIWAEQLNGDPLDYKELQSESESG